MMFDPVDQKIAMDEHGILYHVAFLKSDEDGNPVPEWIPLQRIDFRGEFRRPEF